MDPFCRDLITEWRRLSLPNEGETVVVAVSGGADSVSLLLVLHELKQIGKLDLRIVAAHFNHRLRGDESNADEQFVRELTSSRKIEFAAGHTPISKDGNLEQNARTERYRFLARTAQNLHAAGVITGHTMNDQAETFLMNLIRGSGIEGLSGMKPVRSFDSEVSSSDGPNVHPLSLVRPLLTWAKRSDTHGLPRVWITPGYLIFRQFFASIRRKPFACQVMISSFPNFNPVVLKIDLSSVDLPETSAKSISKVPRFRARVVMQLSG